MVWGRALYIFPSEWGGSICSDFQRREGGRGFDRFIGNSKGVRSNPSNPPSYAPEISPRSSLCSVPFGKKGIVKKKKKGNHPFSVPFLYRSSECLDGTIDIGWHR